MSLRYPWMLLLLLLVPLLVYLRYRRNRTAALSFSDSRAFDTIRPSWAIRAQPVLPVLYGAALVALAVAMARPQRGLEESRVRTEAVDIVLLVDVSTSMRALDFSQPGRTLDRLDAAKAVIQRFIRSRPHDRIGMVAFSAMPYTVSPLTLDHDWLLQQMDRLKTGMLEDGTAIGDGLASAVNRLRDSIARSKVVVLLTDGINNRGTLSPDNAAQAAKALGIKVYTVGAGSSGWVPVPGPDLFGGQRVIRQRSDVDEAALQRIARATAALYFRATDLKGLEDVYAQIDQMEKTEISVDQFTLFQERFAPWLLLSMCCMAAEKMLSLTRLGRLP